MRFILLFCTILAVLCLANGSFANKYPEFKSSYDSEDPGEALYLSELIEKGNIKMAQKLALVKHPEIEMKSYAGYLTVNKTYNSNMFFWFFPSEYVTAPVVLWLNGGPGAPSLFSIFVENGPYKVTDEQKLTPREYSWLPDYSLLYIDNPVGTGFSFTDSEHGYARNQKDVGENVLRALQQFFLLFPEQQKNEFFVGGISYGGKYPPAVGHAIHKENERIENDPKKPKINLKGLVIANGWVDLIHQINYADYLYQLGLIDSNGRKQFEQIQNKIIEYIKARKFEPALEGMIKLILTLPSSKYDTLFTNLTGYTHYTDYTKTQLDVPFDAINGFINKLETRRAIHAGNNTFGSEKALLKVQKYLKLDFMDSVADWLVELLSHYRVLVYTGQLDIIVGYPLVENYLQNLKFSGAEEYKNAKRYIWREGNEIAGYVKYAGNLTDVLIRNAGHFASFDQPKWTREIMMHFTQHKDLNLKHATAFQP